MDRKAGTWLALGIGLSLAGQVLSRVLERAGLLAYVHGDYFTLGRKIGKFGWSVSKAHRKPGPGRK